MLWALGFFCEQFLEDHGVQSLLGDELLEFAVFFFQEPQAFGLIDFEAAKLLLPLVESGLADAVSPAQLDDGRASLSFLEDVDDLFFGMSGSLQGLGFVENLYPEPA